MFYFEKLKTLNQVQSDKMILKSDLIQEAEAFFTTRDICICDKGFDLNPHPGPLPKGEGTLENNKKIIADYLKINEKSLIMPEQTHSANIDIAIETRHKYPETDSLILTQKNIGIFLNFADCTPIILYDKKQNIGAVVHAGWRGTAQKITPLTVKKMKENFNSKPSDIVAAIGPAIGFCCYNVGEEVYEKLSKTVENFNGLYELREGNIFVDLKNINKKQLEETGVEKIDVCPYCTVHNNDIFFSYRNENATTKRHSAVLKLR